MGMVNFRFGRQDWATDDAWQDKAFDLHYAAVGTLRDAVEEGDPAALTRVTQLVGSHLFALSGFGASSVESPIEALFYLATFPYTVRGEVDISAQLQFGRYRADFVLRLMKTDDPFGATPSLVVELDGHDFHERTKEQAKRDKARDRWFIEQGHRVVRFTGSEVWNDAETCAAEAVRILKAGS